jgi:sec-independent protein translocase protein TatB
MRAQLAMFDFNWGELILIGIVALVAIGPKELPGALRTLGQWVAKARRMANEFQNQFHEALREAELVELKKEVDEMASKAQSYAHFDAIDDIRKDLENAASPPHELVKPLSTTPETAGSYSPSPVDMPAESTSSPALPTSLGAAQAAAESAAFPGLTADSGELASDTSGGSETSPATVEPEAGRRA